MALHHRADAGRLRAFGRSPGAMVLKIWKPVESSLPDVRRIV